MGELIQTIESIKPWLPVNNHRNKTTTELRWILSKHENNETQKQLIQSFLEQNFVTHTKFAWHRGKYNQMVRDNFSREQKMDNIMKNPWLAFEYFLVDQLNRYKYKYRWVNIYHRKWSPYLDHKRKVDYTSHIEQKNKQDISVWVQLTTHQSKAKIFPSSYKYEMKQKRKVVKDLSQNIFNNQELKWFQRDWIDLTAYMIVNGHINEVINMERDNIFATAFEKRKAAKLPWWGPVKYLPKKVRQDMWTIRLTYHLSLLDFSKHLNKAKKDPELRTTPTQELYTHKKDSYIIRRDFNPEIQEFTHNVFIDHSDPEKANLLFSLSYFLNSHITKKEKFT